MSPRIFIPADSTARSLGADAVAAAVRAAAPDTQVVRTGSRGLYWLEPLLEIETAAGRIGFGPLSPADIANLFATGLPDNAHPDCLGLIEELPWLQRQQRLTAERFGVIDPLDINDYCDHGGFKGLLQARSLTSAQIVAAVTESGLRGRGGAGFPTGIKWQTVLNANASSKYIVCNADEGDSGTFVDRMLMESDPFSLIEGMIIAGLAVGASSGFIYCRAEYPQAITTLQAAIASATAAGYLEDFSLQVRTAAGAYICGEETALLESLEGRRGMVRYRPPLPALEGLWGQPTVVNNVISLATVPWILAHSGADYHRHGVERSRGTLTVQLAGNVLRAGLYGLPIKAVQAGGPLGAYIPPSQLDTPLDYEAFKAIGAMIGHGGIVVFDSSADLGAMARFAMEFCAEESCGKCTPCRIGAVRGVEVIDRIRNGTDAADNRLLLHDLCQTMIDGSLCALGGMTPYPVLSVIQHFPEEL